MRSFLKTNLHNSGSKKMETGLETAGFEFEIYAIPDGEGDYDFASVVIEATGTVVKDSYCRF